ncbi:hypothetical protein RS84_00008 [Microbacterium hydrocarbonoxydans]|uniref:Uncharacterized protein n=1 Tax=Microbacterium hydrocarbonoxydans TaxID=273678 RepID=A0A0M2HYN4_9MICO|nr:hypothetical protein [Microbacterium hydrocarbonoxydans]KJL49534.1 hypothetical protein RS84_00008 [Microbacterium hydrocarbonoxydans]
MSSEYIVDRVARYERRRARGMDSALEHEELHELVDTSMGAVAGAFFDKERTLPLATGGLPWPMKQHDAYNFRVTRFALSGLGLIAGLLMTPPLAGLWNLLTALAAAGAVYCLVTFLPKLFRPRDIDERFRLVSVYIQLVSDAERSADARRLARKVAVDSEFDRIKRREFGD